MVNKAIITPAIKLPAPPGIVLFVFLVKPEMLYYLEKELSFPILKSNYYLRNYN